MSAVLFGGIVLAILVVLGFALYGVFLGMAILAGHLRGAWLQILAYHAQNAGLGTGSSYVDGGCGQARPERRCWEYYECLEGFRGLCPAARRPDVPCWLANMEASPENRLKAECVACKLFDVKELMATV